MKDWLKKNHEVIIKSQNLKKLNNVRGYLKNDNSFQSFGKTRMIADIYEDQLRRIGIFSNKAQSHMISSLPKI